MKKLAMLSLQVCVAFAVASSVGAALHRSAASSDDRREALVATEVELEGRIAQRCLSHPEEGERDMPSAGGYGLLLLTAGDAAAATCTGVASDLRRLLRGPVARDVVVVAERGDTSFVLPFLRRERIPWSHLVVGDVDNVVAEASVTTPSLFTVDRDGDIRQATVWR